MRNTDRVSKERGLYIDTERKDKLKKKGNGDEVSQSINAGKGVGKEGKQTGTETPKPP